MTRLYRSTRDKKVSGLCGGLAEVLNVDSNLLRLVVVVTAVFSAGTVLLLYFLASIVIPKEPFPPYHYSSGYEPPPHFDQGSKFQQASYEQTQYSDYHTSHSSSEQRSNLDEMMKDVETKALWKEIEDLRARLAKYEKGDGS